MDKNLHISKEIPTFAHGKLNINTNNDMTKKLQKIFNNEVENNLVHNLLGKCQKNNQTIYGELCDWFKDYHRELSLSEREEVIERLLGNYMKKNFYKIKFFRF